MPKTKSDALAADFTAYMDGVLSEKIPAATLVKRCVLRHLADVRDGAKRGLRFDFEAGARVVRYFTLLHHWKGEWAGEPFQLNLWQKFRLIVLFGWKRADGTRRFRTGYTEVPRKNGKTSEIAGVGLYFLTADGEAGAEIYSAATKKDQARIILTDAEMMRRRSPALRSRVVASGGKYVQNLAYLPTASKFEVLAADSEKLDGLNVHAGLIDELHAHKDRKLWDVLDTATGARRQPMMLAITTAGSDEESIGGELHRYGERILEGFDKPDGVKDDTFFAFISAADKDDDPYSPATWAKANPNLGVSVKLDDLERKAARAKELPSARNAFLRLHLNIWTQTETAWLDLDKWDACRGVVDLEKLKGCECWGGLDLASKLDLTAFVLVFRKDEKYFIREWFWMPEEAAKERRRKEPFWGPWLDQGLIEMTPGSVTDYGFIENQIAQCSHAFDLKEIAFDPWNATQTATRLKEEHGIEMVEFRQGFASMNEPSKEFEKLIASRNLIQGGNPLMRWMIGNVAVKEDPAGNIKPVKPESKTGKKIDGVVASIMGLGRAMLSDSGDIVFRSF